MTDASTTRGTAADRRVAVSLTFDFDAESAWLGSFKVDTPSALSRGAYCANEGVPRILKLLDLSLQLHHVFVRGKGGRTQQEDGGEDESGGRMNWFERETGATGRIEMRSHGGVRSAFCLPVSPRAICVARGLS